MISNIFDLEDDSLNKANRVMLAVTHSAGTELKYALYSDKIWWNQYEYEVEYNTNNTIRSRLIDELSFVEGMKQNGNDEYPYPYPYAL
jgi:hypothetical protein